jgi:hypothetical protein
VALAGDLSSTVVAFKEAAPFLVVPAKAALAFPLVYHYVGASSFTKALFHSYTALECLVSQHAHPMSCFQCEPLELKPNKAFLVTLATTPNCSITDTIHMVQCLKPSMYRVPWMKEVQSSFDRREGKTRGKLPLTG